MSMSNRSQHDKEMASYMKAHPGAYPDSAMRPWGGVGAGDRALAYQMGTVTNNTSKWHNAMLAGVIFARLGLGASGVPDDLVRRAA